MLAQAQRMSSLLASDREFASCRIERGAYDAERCEKRCGPGDVRALSGMHREGPTQGCGGAQGTAERTLNMDRMFVTLDVLKLSGWLNAVADCRVERRACNVGRGTAQEREGVGRWQCKRHAQGGPDSRRWGGRARAERTWNMDRMLVTLDVSKLSAWLNVVAYCRVERWACNVGRGAAQEREGVEWRRRSRHAWGGADF